MTSSVARLLRLITLLVLCFTAVSARLSAIPPGGGGYVEDCSGTVAVCAPGENRCVFNCNCEGNLGCCIEKCDQCCGG